MYHALRDGSKASTSRPLAKLARARRDHRERMLSSRDCLAWPPRGEATMRGWLPKEKPNKIRKNEFIITLLSLSHTMQSNQRLMHAAIIVFRLKWNRHCSLISIVFIARISSFHQRYSTSKRTKYCKYRGFAALEMIRLNIQLFPWTLDIYCWTCPPIIVAGTGYSILLTGSSVVFVPLHRFFRVKI